jgi:C4-dicarboxylate-specific signal transduction histidine kinase
VAALGELTASLAHEINQPLAAILNSAEAAAALLDRASPDIAEAMEAIHDIIQDDKRAGSVIHKMRGMLNLVTNGIEAAEIMPDRRVVEIRTCPRAHDRMQTLEVRDSGPGIPSGKLTTVFEPFYTTKREGLGFGLSICRSIVDSFGGRITVEKPARRRRDFSSLPPNVRGCPRASGRAEQIVKEST